MTKLSGFSKSGPSAAALLGCIALFAGPARADDPGAKCSSSFESAQREHARGAFIEASAAARACSQIECNALIVPECIKLLDQIRAETPSMVFSAHGSHGEELTAVRVLIDGKPAAQQLDGMPIEVNPGAHKFRFETEGQDPVEIQHTARVGDKNRLIDAQIGKLLPTEPSAAASQSSAMGPIPAKRDTSVPAASYVLAGVGVVGLGVAGYLRLKATSDYNHLNNTCSPMCNPNDVSPVRTKYQLSYVGLGVGLAAFAGAAIVYVVHRSAGGSATGEVAVLPTLDGARASWSSQF